MTTNQCMGCQAGWPTEINQRNGHTIHVVPGGYAKPWREIVSCTRERYEEIQTREVDLGGLEDDCTPSAGVLSRSYTREVARRLADRSRQRKR